MVLSETLCLREHFRRSRFPEMLFLFGLSQFLPQNRDARLPELRWGDQAGQLVWLIGA
jgi:hypothetical protein